MKTYLAVMLGALAIAAVWVALPYSERSESDGRVRAAFDRVAIGESEAGAASALLLSARGLVLGSDSDSAMTRWTLSAPPRLLQDQWVLVVCVSDGKVQGKQIGTGDHPRVSPLGAPAAEGRCPSPHAGSRHGPGA